MLLRSWCPGLCIALAAASALGSEPVLVAPAQQALLFQPEVRARATELVRVSAAVQDPQDLRIALAAVRDAGDLSPAVRDAVLYAYVRGLREQPVAAIPDAALDWLAGYRAQAMRPHDESAALLVPLFDVSTAAQGLRNEKRHRQARDRWLDADADFDTLIAEYAAALDRPWRGGVEAAVAELPPSTLRQLSTQLDGDPAMAATPLAMRIRMARGDLEGLKVRLPTTDASLAAATLREAAEQWPAVDVFVLAEAALDHVDQGVRGLAIAVGSESVVAEPRLRDAWQQRLLHLLRTPDDGVAAALHLARNVPLAKLAELDEVGAADPELRRRLELVRRLRMDLSQLSAEPETGR